MGQTSRCMSMSVKAMIFYGGKLLLLQKKDKEGHHPWEFPGGGVQDGENFEEALQREVQEETGLSVRILSVGGVWCYKREGDQQLNGVIFTAEAFRDEVHLSSEHLDYSWVTPHEFPQYPIHQSLCKSLAAMRLFDVKKGGQLQQDFLSHIPEACHEE